ncbi:hypothetical protein ACVMAJ_006848 [Bradyrhizobium sp. USDA 4448]
MVGLSIHPLHGQEPLRHARVSRIVDFLVDYDLNIAFSNPPFRGVGERNEAGRHRMRIFRRLINSPPDLPIFKEGEVEQHSAGIGVVIPAEVLLSGIIWLETSIQAPGVTVVEEWSIHCQDRMMRLRPPSSRSRLVR